MTSSKDHLLTLVGESTTEVASSNSFSSLSNVDNEFGLKVSDIVDGMKISYDPSVTNDLLQ